MPSFHLRLRAPYFYPTLTIHYRNDGLWKGCGYPRYIGELSVSRVLTRAREW